jgi:hypothetical protein
MTRVWLSTTMKEKHVDEVHAHYQRNVALSWALHSAKQSLILNVGLNQKLAHLVSNCGVKECQFKLHTPS